MFLYVWGFCIWPYKTSLTPPFVLLKCLYQARKVSGHVIVC
jgi:hypothetical protein